MVPLHCSPKSICKQRYRDEVFIFLPWFSLSRHWFSINTNEAHSFLLISNNRSLWGSPLELGTPSHSDVTLIASCIAQCLASVIFLPIWKSWLASLPWRAQSAAYLCSPLIYLSAVTNWAQVGCWKWNFRFWETLELNRTSSLCMF